MSYLLQHESTTNSSEKAAVSLPVDQLNQLMQQNLDTIESYRAGGERVEVGSLKKMMNYLASKHAGFASDLRTEILRMGGKPIEKSPRDAAFFEGWMQAKDAFSDNTEEAMLKACRIREENTLAEYRLVLRRNALDERTINLFRAHCHRIQDALSHLSELESKYHWMD